MFGFLVGIACLVVFVKLVKGEELPRWRNWADRGDTWLRKRRWVLRWLFERLDTTPGQERVIDVAARDLTEKASALRGSMGTLREGVAQALRGDTFDGDALSAAFDAKQSELEALKTSLRENAQKVHEALDPEQRRQLADLLEFGTRRSRRARRGSRREKRHHQESDREGGVFDL